jgi:hypothetical protein
MKSFSTKKTKTALAQRLLKDTAAILVFIFSLYKKTYLSYAKNLLTNDLIQL